MNKLHSTKKMGGKSLCRNKNSSWFAMNKRRFTDDIHTWNRNINLSDKVNSWLGVKSFEYQTNLENDKWIDNLNIIKSSQKSKDLGLNYFYNHFRKSPSRFYSFIERLKQWIIESASAKYKKKMAQQYFDIVSSLCDRFWFYEEKRTLDDICFNLCCEDEYNNILESLQKYKKESNVYIEAIEEKLKEILLPTNIRYTIINRYKNIYSIAQKIKKKQKQWIYEINDIFAFRIIIEDDSVEHCFDVLNLLHDTYTPNSSCFKDYITIPKINWYQSLHTGLTWIIKDFDLIIEVQIRTRNMDSHAENWLAAHWMYSGNKKVDFIQQKVFNKIYTKNINRIYCFSDNWDLIEVWQWSTIVDFAYKIHSELANRLLWVEVNWNIEDISYTIQEWDKIKLIKSDKLTVHSSWLWLAKQKNTIKKIKNAIKNNRNSLS